MQFELMGIIPIIVIIIVAMWSKRTVPALLVGVILTTIIVGGTKFISTFIDLAYEQGTNEDLVYVIILCAFLFILLDLLRSIGASQVFITMIEKKAKTRKSTMILTWVVSLVLFIDEELKVALLGTLTPLYDKNKIPRATLTYIADSMAGPLSTLIPITWWAVYCQSVFGQYEGLAYLGSPFEIYVKSIPFMFYAMAALLIVTLFVFGVIPPIGAMKKAYVRAEKNGELYGEISKKLNVAVPGEQEAMENIDRKGLRLGILVFILVFLTAGVIITQDLLTVLAVSAAILFILALITKLSTISQLLETASKALVQLVPLVTLMFLAFMFKAALTEMGFPEYIATVAEPIMSPAIFPVCSFILCCLLTFGTGSNLGIATVFATIAVPVGLAVGAAPVLIVASIVSGATFGAHICFYTDYTVLASFLTKIDNMEHALTQLPYGLMGGALSAVAFLVAGFVM